MTDNRTKYSAFPVWIIVCSTGTLFSMAVFGIVYATAFFLGMLP